MTTLALVGVALALGYAVAQMRSSMRGARTEFDEERRGLQTQLSRLENELAEARTALASARRDVETLVQQRMPSLLELEFDRVIPIGAHYVRDITFKSLRESKKLAYEYKIVVENTSSEPVKPAVSVLLFDELGVQVSRSRVAGDLKEAERELRAGEIRSHFAVLELDRERNPAYFLIDPD